MKGWMWGVVGAVLASLLTAIILGFWGSHEKGAEALDEKQIRQVLDDWAADKQVVMIDGETKSYGEAFSIVIESQVRTQAALEALTAD